MARQLSEFEREFAKARAKGEKTFPWNGDTFTTEYKEERTARLAAEKAAKEAKDLKMRTAAEEAADDAKIAESMKKDQAVKETPAAIPLKKPASKPTPRTETKAAKATPEPKVESSLRTKSEPTLSDKEVKSYLKKNPVKAEPTISNKELKGYLKRNPVELSPAEKSVKKFVEKQRASSAPTGPEPKVWRNPRGGGGGGGMSPADIEKVKKPGALKMAKGGYVRTADGCAVKGKTRGRMV